MDQNQQQIQTMDKTEKEIITPGGSPGIVLENPPSKEAGLKVYGEATHCFVKIRMPSKRVLIPLILNN
ncbi:unnamed protein product [Lasius platythorax]|uniref:Uncharacterized protein n=1 Tax=Lasius platythorax TaxID=488582 RepID=A0AAV2NXE8_9HYME